jgi:hypothetical protein
MTLIPNTQPKRGSMHGLVSQLGRMSMSGNKRKKIPPQVSPPPLHTTGKRKRNSQRDTVRKRIKTERKTTPKAVVTKPPRKKVVKNNKKTAKTKGKPKKKNPKNISKGKLINVKRTVNTHSGRPTRL